MHRPKFDPTDPKSLIAFTFYGFLVAFLGALTPEVIKKPAEWLWIWLLNLAAIGVMIWIFDPIIRAWAQKGRLPVQLEIELRHVRKAKGLLLLVSIGPGAQSARNAIEYHRECLSHVWLIYSSESESLAVDLEKDCKSSTPAISVKLRKLENIFEVDCIERAKSLVDQARKEAARAGLSDHDFICDFTGMNKLAGSGVVLACIRPEHRLQYMEIKPETGSHPVEIEVNYDVSLL